MIKPFHVDESDYFCIHFTFLMLGVGRQLSMLDFEYKEMQACNFGCNPKGLEHVFHYLCLLYLL